MPIFQKASRRFSANPFTTTSNHRRPDEFKSISEDVRICSLKDFAHFLKVPIGSIRILDGNNVTPSRMRVWGVVWIGSRTGKIEPEELDIKHPLSPETFRQL